MAKAGRARFCFVVMTSPIESDPSEAFSEFEKEFGGVVVCVYDFCLVKDTYNIIFSKKLDKFMTFLYNFTCSLMTYYVKF